MNYLREFDITDEVIKKIRNNNDKSIIQNLIYDEVNVGNVINYLRSINIEVIDELLISRPELFSVDCERLKTEFSKYNIEVLVNLINEDLNAINFL